MNQNDFIEGDDYVSLQNVLQGDHTDAPINKIIMLRPDTFNKIRSMNEINKEKFSY